MTLTSIAIELRHVGLAVWKFYVLVLREPIQSSRYGHPWDTRDPPWALPTHRPGPFPPYQWIEFIRLKFFRP